MSQVASQRGRLDQLADEHERIKHLAEGPSPFIDYMESFYLKKPAGRAAKIMSADWIPYEARDHMLRHINARLAGTGGQRGRPKKVDFRGFVTNPRIEIVSSKKFVYTRTVKGQILKRQKSNGRFAKFNRQEKSIIRRSKQP